MKKIKNFKSRSFDSNHLLEVEEKVNEFNKTHNVLDVKVNVVKNQYSNAFMCCTVVYEEGDDSHAKCSVYL